VIDTKPQSAGASSTTSRRYLPSDLDYKHRVTGFKVRSICERVFLKKRYLCKVNKNKENEKAFIHNYLFSSDKLWSCSIQHMVRK
jgi:hypothetical protein